jgi:hypothetical protein
MMKQKENIVDAVYNKETMNIFGIKFTYPLKKQLFAET